MHTIFNVIKYQLRDVSRSRWIFIYTFFFFAVTYGLLTVSTDLSKVMVSLMNISLLLIPMVSIIFGTVFFYNNREYITFMLSQPINRRSLFVGLYFGLTIPLLLSFVIGIGVPQLLHINTISQYPQSFILIILTGILLTFIFSGIAFWISTVNNDRLKGLGAAIFLWLVFAVIYDGFILLLLQTFRDYPLENISIAVSMFNPVDTARILIMTEFDIPALMGYTGAVFDKIFGSTLGALIAVADLLLWGSVPFIITLHKFNKRDF